MKFGFTRDLRARCCPVIPFPFRVVAYRTCRRYSSDEAPENRNYLIDPFEYSSNERFQEIPPLHVVPNSTAHPFCREIIRATGGNWVSQSTISYKSLFQPRCANVKRHPERITDRPMELSTLRIPFHLTISIEFSHLFRLNRVDFVSSPSEYGMKRGQTLRIFCSFCYRVSIM